MLINLGRADILTIMSLLTHVHLSFSTHCHFLLSKSDGFHHTGLVHVMIDLYLIISVLVLLQLVKKKIQYLVAYC